MVAPKKPETFDAHLGALISNLARPKGGRAFIAELLGYNVKTINRRSVGDGEYTVREMNLIANALGMTSAEIADLALRNYSGGTAEDGIRKLLEEEGLSEGPASLDAHREKKAARPAGKRPSEMTEEELDAFEGESAANTDPELGHDEPDAP